MKVGDLVRSIHFEHSVGVIVPVTETSFDQDAYWVFWFEHFYDTGNITPVYTFQVEVISECR
tara:strand:+ start:529 stop:714 length:186 start_codon:yes stop_codon:yes gene_type:complete